MHLKNLFTSKKRISIIRASPTILWQPMQEIKSFCESSLKSVDGYKLPIALIALGSLTFLCLVTNSAGFIMKYGIAQQSWMACAQLGCTFCIPVSAAAAIIAHCSNSPKARSCSLALLGLSLSSALILHAIQFNSLDSAGLSNTLGGMILQSSGTAVSDLNAWNAVGTEAGIAILPAIIIAIGLGMALNHKINKSQSRREDFDDTTVESTNSIGHNP